jgi:aminoglycoside phosphotransferase family enzyme/predicted kinase
MDGSDRKAVPSKGRIEAMSLHEDLLRPDAYPDVAAVSVELVQTHISWVFLLKNDVFKVKRPVVLGFLDFGSIEARKAACEAELRLNARLAGGIYLDVVPIVRDHDGRHRVGGPPGSIVDWAVHMRRLPEARRADHLLQRGELTAEIVDGLAARIARFHADAAADECNMQFGSAAAVASCVEGNFAETASTMTRYVRQDEADEIKRWQRAFLQDHARLFDQRIAAGRVRDGHGDLRLEHVYVAGDPSPLIIDCIEYNDRFRYADVCSDVAFLSMDLAAHGRVDLAERLLSRYARDSNDFDLFALVDFYESYRAYVRGKIASIVADDESIAWSARKQAHDDARRYFLLALSSHRRPLLGPSVIVVGGLIASGKSTIAEAISSRMNAPIVDADRTRKAMLGVTPHHPVHEPAWRGAYDPEVTAKVYGEVLRRASVVLASGRPVVIDASFRSQALRSAARDVAIAKGAPFLFVECRVDRQLAKARLEERSRGPAVSDGRLAIFDAFAAEFEPVTELSDREHIAVDTERDLQVTLAQLNERLNLWPEGLSG